MKNPTKEEVITIIKNEEFSQEELCLLKSFIQKIKQTRKSGNEGINFLKIYI